MIDLTGCADGGDNAYAVMDAHIHLDDYESGEQAALMESLRAENIRGLIAVSKHLDSCRATLRLAKQRPGEIFAAFGYHPEQPLPTERETDRLIAWIRAHRDEMIAVGEVGLPYYLRQEAEAKGKTVNSAAYDRLLERFVALAAELDKPIVLHAVYDDAEPVCDLLDKHGIRRAHFHWFKGDETTLKRMAASGYYISLTPDIVYKPNIQSIARAYPLELLMAETDGPWPFAGPWETVTTHPRMIRETAAQIARIKGLSEREVGLQLYANTCKFYKISL